MYIASLPCNLSLIVCFLVLTFHKVVWQHMKDVAGFSILYFTAKLPRNMSVKKILKIGKDLTELWPRVCGLTFLAHPVQRAQN